MPSRNLFIIFIFISATFLSGCVANNVDLAKKLSAQTNVPTQEGILVARVINTTSYRLPFNQLFIDPKEVNSSKAVKTILAYSEDRPIGDSSLFAVSLPQGEYSLSTVRSIIFRGEGYYSRSAHVDPEFGVFKVESGKVTDLGTIVYYAKPQDDVYEDIVVRLPDSANGKVLLEYFPQYAAQAEDILTWQADERDEQRFAQYSSAAQNPITFVDEILAPDGSLYFLGKLGVILRYSLEDGFEITAIDSDLQVNAFAQNDAGDRVAGGFEGALFFQAEGEDWEAVNLPKSATVHHLKFYQENQFDVLYSTGQYLYVARYNKEDLSTGELLNTYNYDTRWKLAGKALKARQKPAQLHHIKNVWVTQKGDQRLLNVSSYKEGKWSAFDATDVETYLFAEDTWKTDLVEGSEEMDSILTAGKVELGIKQAGFWTWTGRPSYYTRANDNSPWQEVSNRVYGCSNEQVMQANGTCLEGNKAVKAKSESFTFRSRPWFWSAQNGLAVVNFSDTDFWSGQRTSETKILITEDGGASWKKTELSLPKPYCSDIVGLITDRILLSCDGATSDFYESYDHGETWQHIRQQQDF